jgi:hypothetical protein
MEVDMTLIEVMTSLESPIPEVAVKDTINTYQSINTQVVYPQILVIETIASWS